MYYRALITLVLCFISVNTVSGAGVDYEPDMQLPLSAYYSTLASFDEKVAEFEGAMSTTLKDVATASNSLDFIAGSFGVGALYQFYQGAQESLRRRQPKRWIGAAGGAVAIVSPLLKPLGMLAVGAYAWYRLKQSILAPCWLKHQEEIEKFKVALAEHKKSIVEERKAFIIKIDEALQAVKREVDEEFKAIHQEHATLQKHVTGEIKALSAAGTELQKDMYEKQDALNHQVTGLMQTVQQDLDPLRHDISELKEGNQKIQQNIALTSPRVLKVLESVRQIKEDLEQELEVIKQSVDGKSPPKNPSPPKSPKKKGSFFARLSA